MNTGQTAPPHHAYYGLCVIALPEESERNENWFWEKLHHALLARVTQTHDCWQLPGQSTGTSLHTRYHSWYFSLRLYYLSYIVMVSCTKNSDILVCITIFRSLLPAQLNKAFSLLWILCKCPLNMQKGNSVLLCSLKYSFNCFFLQCHPIAKLKTHWQQSTLFRGNHVI